jgi:hypothetical protein
MAIEEGLIPPQQPQPAVPGQPVATSPQPAAPGGPPVATPQVQRDYESNPINQEDMDNVDKFSIMATKLIHTPQTRDKVLSRIKGVQHPYDEIADASLVIVNRLEQEANKAGEPWDQSVKLMGGADVVQQVVELAAAAGKIPGDIPEDDHKVILGQTIQKYYQQKIASGEITKAQAAEDAHMAAQTQANIAGQDTSGTNKRLQATQELRDQGVVPGQTATGPQKMQTPTPAADPMNPDTTMKEVLAAGPGGLLDA